MQNTQNIHLMPKYTHEQLRVIKHDLTRHALVSAVAGSGKTQTLIGRIAFLLKSNVPASKILVVMFNKSACNEFYQRLSQALGSDIAGIIQVKTFHAFGFSLSQYFENCGYLPKRALVTKSVEVERLVRSALQKTHQLLQVYDEITTEKIELYSNYIALLKSEVGHFSQGSLSKKLTAEERTKVEVFYQLFERLRQERQLKTFDDLIYEPALLLHKNKKLATEVQQNYQHVIVDEYQDINSAQHFLLKTIAANAYVMAVGDVDQTIYEWRGSKPYYMLQGFAKTFPALTHYHLSYTFRYGHLLSMMSNEVIQYNDNRHKKHCFSWPVGSKQTDIDIYGKRQVSTLIQKIKTDVKQGKYKYDDTVVLVRKYSCGVLFELSCLKNGLPYEVMGSSGVFELKITQALLGYLLLSSHALGLYKRSLEERRRFITAMLSYPSLYLNSIQLKQLSGMLAQTPDDSSAFLTLLKQHDFPHYQQENIQRYAQAWQAVCQMPVTKPAYQLLQAIQTQFDLQNFLRKKASHNQIYSDEDVVSALNEFARSQQKSTEDFIDYCFKLQQVAQLGYQQQKTDHKLIISSIHRAKGLQWRHVVLFDMTEGSFFGDDKPTPTQIESERRLFYVAITRACMRLSIVAGNDIAKLDDWFKSAPGGYPASLRKTNSVRFLYESKLWQVQNFLHAFSENDTKQMNNYAKCNKIVANYWQRLQSETV
ncbi:ATP-dependent helicase [Facilibium subflavum]|uniref:ATP-dependent helicase n=1 Tax=Facilibium subflavum TaxID=2219058 RepID=UPI000E654A46|nr:ATP-dependent helicase [Facilibium subflavum]